MYKNILLLILAILIFSGCSKNEQIDQYNSVSQKHQEESLIAFGELSNSLRLYNEKKYDEAIASSDKCISYYETTKQYSQEGKNIAQSAKLANWIQEFKTISINSEDLRIKQCNLIKSVSSEAKKINPDTEMIANLINEISDLNDEFNKLQITLNDMQNQHANNFN